MASSLMASSSPADGAAHVQERPFHACFADQDVIEMGTVGLHVRENGITRGLQSAGLLPPVRIIRNLRHLHVEFFGQAFHGVVFLYMPVHLVQVVLDMFTRREITLVILQNLHHGHPCYGRDIRVLCEGPDARDHVRISPSRADA